MCAKAEPLSDQLLQVIEPLIDPNGEGDTCYYIYDLDRIREQVEKLQKHLPEQVRVYYAVKANPHPRILEKLSNMPYIKGVEIASAGELEACEKYFHCRQIIYTGPAKTKKELQLAVDHQIRQIHVESLSEIERLEQGVLADGDSPIDILVRLNGNFELNHITVPLAAQMAGKASKFGIDEDQFEAIVDRLKKCRHLTFTGIHLFAGSGILEAEVFLDVAEYCFALVKSFSDRNIDIDRIDLGGGFGIDYQMENGELDLARIGAGLTKLIQKYSFEDKEVILELGRFIVGECGSYLTPIVDIKSSKGKKFILTSGGINHFRRPLDHGINHPTRIIKGKRPAYLQNTATVHRERVDIGGPLCTPRDFIAKDLYVENARIGDYVLIDMVGAYGLTAASVGFLSHPLPKEVFFDKNQ